MRFVGHWTHRRHALKSFIVFYRLSPNPSLSLSHSLSLIWISSFQRIFIFGNLSIFFFYIWLPMSICKQIQSIHPIRFQQFERIMLIYAQIIFDWDIKMERVRKRVVLYKWNLMDLIHALYGLWINYFDNDRSNSTIFHIQTTAAATTTKSSENTPIEAKWTNESGKAKTSVRL